MKIGEKIKQLRLEKGLTQEELGLILGVKKAAIQKYESGQVQNLKMDTIKKLCETFNKFPAHFIYDDFDKALEKKIKTDLQVIEVIEKRFGKIRVEILEGIIDLTDDNANKVLEYVRDLNIVQSIKKNDEL